MSTIYIENRLRLPLWVKAWVDPHGRIWMQVDSEGTHPPANAVQIAGKDCAQIVPIKVDANL